MNIDNDEQNERIGDIFARACHNNEYFGNDGWYELHTSTVRQEIKELLATQRQALRDEVEKAINQGYPIYLTTDDVAEGNLHDDVVRHWNQLREHQLAAISTIFEGSDDNTL